MGPLLLLLLTGPALAGTTAFVPTADEALELSTGNVVLRPLPSQDGAVRVIGVADVSAPADAIWEALLDFPSRLGGNPSLKAVSEYRARTTTEQWWKWEVSRFGVNVVYHNHYVVDRVAGTLLHELDASMPNDLVHSRGLYQLIPSPAEAGAIRLVYTAESNFGRAIPSFVAQWLAGSGVRDFLDDLVRRAEGA